MVRYLLLRSFLSSWEEVRGDISVRKDEVRWIGIIQEKSGDGDSTLGMICKWCFSAHCFLGNSIWSFVLHTIFATDLTLNDKTELVLLNASVCALPTSCNEFRRAQPERKGRAPCIEFMASGSLHRACLVQQHALEKWKSPEEATNFQASPTFSTTKFSWIFPPRGSFYIAFAFTAPIFVYGIALKDGEWKNVSTALNHSKRDELPVKTFFFLANLYPSPWCNKSRKPSLLGMKQS